jgi:hypothetical protein
MIKSGVFSRLSLMESPNVSFLEQDEDSIMESPTNARDSQVYSIKTKLNSMLFVLSEAYIRNLLIAFHCTLNHAESKIADIHIQDLREDNEKLRIHNEALSDNLNRSTTDFEMIVSQFD